jgi:hypothetical protein
MAARRTRFVSDEFVVEYTDIHPEELWEPGHIVYDWCRQIGTELKEATKAFVPVGGKNSEARYKRVGTGRLLASVYAFGHRTGPESYNLEFGAGMPYASFVHGGTAFQRGGYIYSNLGWANKATVDAIMLQGGPPRGVKPAGAMRGLFMSLPPGAGHSYRYHMRVRGQKANPFLVKAWRVVHFNHEGLPSDLQFTYASPLQGR